MVARRPQKRHLEIRAGVDPATLVAAIVNDQDHGLDIRLLVLDLRDRVTDRVNFAGEIDSCCSAAETMVGVASSEAPMKATFTPAKLRILYGENSC